MRGNPTKRKRIRENKERAERAKKIKRKYDDHPFGLVCI